MNGLRMLYCWHDIGLMVALTLSSPDKLFSGCPKQSERGFIRENDFTPVLSSPIPVPLAEYPSVPDVFLGEKWLLCCPSVKPFLCKAMMTTRVSLQVTMVDRGRRMIPSTTLLLKLPVCYSNSISMTEWSPALSLSTLTPVLPLQAPCSCPCRRNFLSRSVL